MPLGIIGGGAMGSALISGVLKAGLLKPGELYLTDVDTAKCAQAAALFGIQIAHSLDELATSCQIIILAVKPATVAGVLQEINAKIGADHLIISIAAGVTINSLESHCPTQRIARVMPNTPTRVGLGVSAYCLGKNALQTDTQEVEKIFNCVGIVVPVPEHLMDAVTALSGSGPAYVYLFIEALIDAGVMAGLPREKATLMAIHTVMGAAEMVKQTGEHPAKLKNDVTSPAGTTAAGLFELEKFAFSAAIGRAVQAAAQRSKELGRTNG